MNLNELEISLDIVANSLRLNETTYKYHHGNNINVEFSDDDDRSNVIILNKKTKEKISINSKALSKIFAFLKKNGAI